MNHRTKPSRIRTISEVLGILGLGVVLYLVLVLLMTF